MTIKRTISAFATLILILAIFLVRSDSIVRAQTDNAIKPADVFAIPEFNSTIRIAVNCTCGQLNFKNNEWVFVNLVLNNSNSLVKLNLTVSARNCNLTIISYDRYNSSFAGSPAINTRLRYNVSGIGSQAFNLHLDPEEGDYSVIADGVFLGLFDGWSISPDSTLIIAGEHSDVRIAYYGHP